jgi:hypothetical protein
LLAAELFFDSEKDGGIYLFIGWLAISKSELAGLRLVESLRLGEQKVLFLVFLFHFHFYLFGGTYQRGIQCRLAALIRDGFVTTY